MLQPLSLFFLTSINDNQRSHTWKMTPDLSYFLNTEHLLACFDFCPLSEQIIRITLKKKGSNFRKDGTKISQKTSPRCSDRKCNKLTLFSSGSRPKEWPLSAQFPHLTKNTPEAGGLGELESIAAKRHLTTSAPVDRKAPELPAHSKITN